LGGGGERILYHADGQCNPAKYQLLLRFDGGDCLSVTVQGWGCVQLVRRDELGNHPYVGKAGVSPLSDDFTYGYFSGLFAALAPGDPRSIKFFCISQPGLWGVGNGYLQDILFRARLHPRRRAGELGIGERQALYRAICATLQQAAALNGRDTERDLYNRPGCYRRILESSKVGRPCPTCGTPIEKIQFLGGAAYFCPRCQVEQPAIVAGRTPI
jgi:formamidopyrimidine-DNA glycosylase